MRRPHKKLVTKVAKRSRLVATKWVEAGRSVGEKGSVGAQKGRMSKAKKSQIEYPKETRGSKVAAENRKETNELTDSKRDGLFDRGMQIIYGAAGKAKAAVSR